MGNFIGFFDGSEGCLSQMIPFHLKKEKEKKSSNCEDELSSLQTEL
jgi:hypothetical protein